MLNTDIFNFEFVDRFEERYIIDNYLFSDSEYALWVHGKRGAGKSFFLSEYVASKKDFTSIYVNLDIDNITSGAYLKEFISVLNKSTNLKFISYLRANYNSIAMIGQKAVNTIFKLTELDDIGLSELSSSVTEYFISKYGERENTVLVIKKYMLEAIKKCGNIVFILIILASVMQCPLISLWHLFMNC